MFNSIGVIGLLVLAGVLLTTATAPANTWQGPSITDYPGVEPVVGLASSPPSALHHPGKSISR
jgi:hypothetical protein